MNVRKTTRIPQMDTAFGCDGASIIGLNKVEFLSLPTKSLELCSTAGASYSSSAPSCPWDPEVSL